MSSCKAKVKVTHLKLESYLEILGNDSPASSLLLLLEFSFLNSPSSSRTWSALFCVCCPHVSALSGSLLGLCFSNINSIFFFNTFLFSNLPYHTHYNPHPPPPQYRVNNVLGYVFVFIQRKLFRSIYSKILEIICVVDLLTIFNWYKLSSCLICFVSTSYFL